MSTKTTLKRLALVAVSALGLSLVSTLPANAVTTTTATYSAPTTYSVVTSGSLSAGSATIATPTITLTGNGGAAVVASGSTNADVATLAITPNSMVSVGSISVTSDLATVNTTTAHGFVTGNKVIISGATVGAGSAGVVDTTVRTITVVSSTSFTYDVQAADHSFNPGANARVMLEADKAFFDAVTPSLTVPTWSSGSATVNTANALTNSVAAVSTGSVMTYTISVTPLSAGYTSAVGQAYLISNAPGIPNTANNGVLKYTLSIAGGGTVGTFPSTLTLSYGTALGATTTISPTTGAANIAAGGSATLTITQPFTNMLANLSTPNSRSFTLSTGSTASTLGSTFNVTGVATGGSVSVVRETDVKFNASLLKDTNTGAFSVTYTITVNAPASAVQGDTIRIISGSTTFTLTVFGGQTWNGNLTALNRAQNLPGWLGGNAQLYAPGTASGTHIGSIEVQSGTDLVPSLKPAWTFTMTGVGNFSLDGGVTRASYVAVSAGASAGATARIYGDGRAGVGTLTITANGNVVATQVVNFYGPATKIVVVPIYTIATAGDGTSGYPTGKLVSSGSGAVCASFTPAKCVGAGNDVALAVQVQDDLGTPMPIQVGVAGGVLMSSSNTTSISPVVTDTFLDAGLPGATAGILLNHVTYSTTATAKSGDKATLTFSHVNSLGATITATQDVTVGGSSTKGGTVTIALDKASYSAGERMKLTVTAKDASGNKVADNVAVGALNGNKDIRGLASGYYYDGSYILGDDAGEDLFAPTTTGAFEVLLYTGTASGATVKVTATVGDDAATIAANAATDAAAEAIDAANAATDAANLAAEAADAATVAAEEARDAADAATAAVEELATQVATLMAALKAQITTLANTVAKIAKKVKA